MPVLSATIVDAAFARARSATCRLLGLHHAADDGLVASSSPSLSGRVGVKRFQTAPSIWCGMFTRRGLASLRDRHLGPPMMGSGGCGGPIYRDVLAVRLTAGIRTRNGLASSIVPAGTSLHRSAEFAFSPVRLAVS